MDSPLEGGGFEFRFRAEVASASPRHLNQPTGLKQSGVLFGHLDDAILADGDMPARKGLD